MRVVAFALGILGSAMVWQHVRYRRARRDIAQDRQPLLHRSARFHVVTFLELRAGDDLLDALRPLRRAIEAPGTAQLVYAGQAAFTAASTQLGPRSWDAVVLVQYASREAYQAAAESEAYRDALAAFARTYSHGMRRSSLLNLVVPQALLGLRLVGLLRGKWNVGEFEAASAAERSERTAGAEERIASLRSLATVNADAVVVFNLTRAGDRKQRAADRAYGRRMATRFAALGHGPIHVGSAVTLEEGGARFDHVVIVYYPGVDYFAEMLESRFFNAIIDDKQLADTQAVPTVPILSRL